MRILWALFVCLVISFGVAMLALPEDGQKAHRLDWLGQSIFVSFFLLVALDILLSLGGAETQQPAIDTDNLIVVDGSNVMHWGGDPSFKILSRVLDELHDYGYTPLVYFDANVGYKLFNKHIDKAKMARKLDLPSELVVFAPSGVPADGLLIERAINEDVQIVTNDRYMDWKVQFPKVGKRGFLIKGIWKQGSVIFLSLNRVS